MSTRIHHVSGETIFVQEDYEAVKEAFRQSETELTQRETGQPVGVNAATVENYKPVRDEGEGELVTPSDTHR